MPRVPELLGLRNCKDEDDVSVNEHVSSVLPELLTSSWQSDSASWSSRFIRDLWTKFLQDSRFSGHGEGFGRYDGRRLVDKLSFVCLKLLFFDDNVETEVTSETALCVFEEDIFRDRVYPVVAFSLSSPLIPEVDLLPPRQRFDAFLQDYALNLVCKEWRQHFAPAFKSPSTGVALTRWFLFGWDPERVVIVFSWLSPCCFSLVWPFHQLGRGKKFGSFLFCEACSRSVELTTG